MDEHTDRIHEVACNLSERTGLSIEEAADCISRAVQLVKESLKAAVDELTRIFEELEESGFFDIEPRARRRKSERDRARIAEQTYRTKTKHFERTRPFRRIYKPP